MIFTSYIKDPIYNEINFKHSQWALKFVNSIEFKRLQNIYQLGISYKIFPSATNTRFLHSIGTFQVASQFSRHFQEKYNINEEDIKIFLLSALLHDIGHGPFSHVFEKISKISHEQMTIKIISNKNGHIYKLLKEENINPERVVDVFLGKYKQPWVNKLISSNLDVDRIDYMLRDAHFLGTHYSTIDLNFLVQRAYIIDHDIVFSDKAQNIIESFLMGRFYMHNDIYDNKNTYVYEWSLESIFSRLKEIKNEILNFKNKIYYFDLYSWIIFDENPSIDTYLGLNDFNLSAFIDSLKLINDHILNSFISFFLNGEELSFVSLNSKKANLILEKAKAHKIDSKYLYYKLSKKNKLFYLENKAYAIKTFNEIEKKVEYFSYKELLDFTNGKTKQNEKILLFNKSLIF